MSPVTIAILGVSSFAMTCIKFAATKVRNKRRRQDRLSIAFERAQESRREAASLR